MGLGNAPCQGQADAEAAGGARAGIVRPVEAVEEAAQLLLVQHLAGVGALQHHPPVRPGQLQSDCTAGQGVFDGIVQQDGHQLPDGGLIPMVGNARGDGQLQGVARGLGAVPEGLRRVLHCGADIEVGQGDGGLLLVKAGQGHQVSHQLAHLVRLGLGLVNPSLLPHLHLQHLQAGGNDGEGGLELVGGVGDELLLLLGAAHHRVDGPPGEEGHQQVHQHQAHLVRRQ